MTRETKIGLLVGMGVIILIGILISDHLSVAQSQRQARIASAPELRSDQIPAIPNPSFATRTPRQTLPLPEEPRTLRPAQSAAPAPAVADAAPAAQRPVPQPDRLMADLTQAINVGAEGRPAPARATQQAMPSGDFVPAGQPQVGDAPAGFAPRNGRSPESYPHPAQPTHVREIPAPAPTAVTTRPAAPAQAPTQVAAAAVPAPAPVVISNQPSAPSAVSHVIHNVRDGETLYGIARKYYGDGSMASVILEANKRSIPSANRLRSGVRLVIPAKPGAAPAAAATASARPVAPAATTHVAPANTATAQASANTPAAVTNVTAAPAASATTTATLAMIDYTVKEGDTLAGLAKQFLGTRNWQKLYELNKDRIANPDRVKPGTVIRVPRKTAA